MLEQRVCVKCLKEWAEVITWSEVDAYFWEETGTMRCPHVLYPRKLGSRLPRIPIKESPPDFCPYKFEHGVATGMEKSDA